MSVASWPEGEADANPRDHTAASGGRSSALCVWHPYDPSGMDRSGEPTLRLVIFDLDGVMYRGRQPVPGAAVLVFRDPDNIQLELFADPPGTGRR